MAERLKIPERFPQAPPNVACLRIRVPHLVHYSCIGPKIENSHILTHGHTMIGAAILKDYRGIMYVIRRNT